MTSERVFIVVAGTVFLGLGALAAVRGRREPLAARFAALTLDLFAYEVCELLSRLSPHGVWDALSSAFGDVSVPLCMHFTLSFLGQERRRRRLLAGTYLYFGTLALLSIVSVSGWPQPDFPDSAPWAIGTLGGMVPTLGVVVALLVRHLRRAQPEEKARTQLTLAALALGAGGAATDLASIATGSGPRLSGWGLLGCAITLGAVALRVKLLEGVTPLVGITAGALAVFGVLAQVAVFQAFGRFTALLFLGTLVVTFAVLAAARHLVSTYTAYRARTEYHARLGRLSAQMAHDIKNPLGAIKGAAQLLQEEVRRGNAVKPMYLELIVEQADRLASVIDAYQRLGKVEPRPTKTDASLLVSRTVEAARAGSPEARIEPVTNGPIQCELDPELVLPVLSNLVRNALEATDGKGHVKVEAKVDELDVVLAVTDDGPGMDVRTRARAGEEFFTTKAAGSGLGLSFAKRVAEAHGGRLSIESEPGKGTRVALELPVLRS